MGLEPLRSPREASLEVESEAEGPGGPLDLVRNQSLLLSPRPGDRGPMAAAQCMSGGRGWLAGTGLLTQPSLAGLPGQIVQGAGVQLPGLPLRPGPELRHAGESAAAGHPQPALPRLRQRPVILKHFPLAVFKTRVTGVSAPYFVFSGLNLNM